MATETAEKTAESFARTDAAGRGVKTRGADAAFIVPDQVPDIAIDGFEGALSVNGLLRLNLVRFRIVPNGARTVREIVATLTMSSATANSFAVALLDALNKQGMLADAIPSPAKANGGGEAEAAR